MRVGFLINPIAGMGGKVGLKGTDGVYEKAVELGAEPVAQTRAKITLEDIHGEHTWFTVGGVMGEESLKKHFPDQEINIVLKAPADIGKTAAEHTHKAVIEFLKNDVDLMLFCGGDGTARDVYEEADQDVPMLGIPAGVKMHSGVFGINPEASAELFNMFEDGQAEIGTVDIMDLDEERYRQGDWAIKFHGEAKSIYEPHYIQLGKQSVRSAGEDELKYDIARYIIEEMEYYPDHIFIMGPGSTTAKVQEILDLDYTILGVDILKNKEIVKLDVAEREILEELEQVEGAKIAVSVIGNQGFFLGRGNQQISPEVVKRVGLQNIYILATPTKLQKTPTLRADTGDPEIDEKIREKEYMRVLQGFREFKLVKVQA
ncbi:MAG: ATP-NAD kinase family protein [Thermoplasmata archaeon]